MAQARILHFLTQYARAHSAGTHTGVAGHDDFTHVAQVVSHITRRQRRCAFRLGFHVLYATCCRFDIVIFFHFAGFQQDSGNHEGDDQRSKDGGDVSKISTFRRHRQYGEDGARRRRRNQTAVQHGQGEHASHTAEDNGKQQTRIHQHIREVDFVDTTQEVNDSRAARRLFSAAATEEHVRQQNAHPRTRVSFDQEEDRLAEVVRLLNTQRREDTVVDGVVEEQDFRRFNKDRRQRQHFMHHHEVNACRQNFGQDFNRRADAEESQNRKDHTDDASGEVIHQHFKTGLDLTVYPHIKTFDRPAAQRTGNHCAEEHWHIGTDDNAHGGDSADHTATIAANQTTTGITDEQRQQIGDHRANQFRQRFVRQPPCWNK